MKKNGMIIPEWLFQEPIGDKIKKIKNRTVFGNKNEEVVDKFETKTPEKTWIDEFVCLKSKAYSFKYGNKNTIKIDRYF